MNELAILGGIWMSLLYSAAVMPASVWVIQLTVSRGWICGLACSLGLALGQLPWCLGAALVLFEFPGLWQAADLWLRGLASAFLIWMAYRSARAPAVRGLHLEAPGSIGGLMKSSLWRSLVMPWRFPVGGPHPLHRGSPAGSRLGTGTALHPRGGPRPDGLVRPFCPRGRPLRAAGPGGHLVALPEQAPPAGHRGAGRAGADHPGSGGLPASALTPGAQTAF